MKYLGVLISFALASAVLIGIACGGEGNVVEQLYVQGAAMEPTFPHGTHVEVLGYGDASPQPGDVIVFYSPTNIDRIFFKRIIALPGDRLEITADGDVLVNGAVIQEPYAVGPTTCSEHRRQVESYAAAGLPLDSTSGGAPKPKPSPRYSPPLAGGESPCDQTVSDGTYFVMGDNRKNSSDSRQGWLVPEENIIGWVEE